MSRQARPPFISVIIPTCHRPDPLRVTLRALARQTYPSDRYEVIVVDNAPTPGAIQETEQRLSDRLRYLTYPCRNATLARNLGAQQAQGELFIFLDDDIELTSATIAALVEEQRRRARAIVVGTLITASPITRPETGLSAIEIPPPGGTGVPIPFTECFTGLLCVKRADFFTLGMFQDPTGGWPNWDDIDFGYRAQLAGYQIIRSPRAIGIHHDAASASLADLARRWYRASRSAVRLFQRYPDMQSHLPMFRDKTPIIWGEDPPRLIARKLARQVASSRPMLWSMGRLAGLLERRYPSPRLLRPLHRWIIGGHILRGYRAGLKENPG